MKQKSESKQRKAGFKITVVWHADRWLARCFHRGVLFDSQTGECPAIAIEKLHNRMMRYPNYAGVTVKERS